jgi:hypothetical protein
MGGPQVGPFTATATIPASFSITNLSSLTSISRTQPLTINWSGTGFDQVQILFEASATTGSTYHGVSMQRAVPAAALAPRSPPTRHLPVGQVPDLPRVALHHKGSH